jgi:hypothetical protein
LAVVTVPTPTGRRVLAAATCTATATTGGPVASVTLRATRWVSKGTIGLTTMVMLLAARHGHVGFSALLSAGLAVALMTARSIAWCRRRLSDRVVAARASLLLGRTTFRGDRLAVLHHLTLPNDVNDCPESAVTAVVRALRPEGGGPRLAVPCCGELARLYSRCEGVEWALRHGRLEQSVLAFLPQETVAELDEARPSVVSITAARRRETAGELELV